MQEIAYEVSQLLLMPVLVGIYGLFIYANVELGRLFALYWLRWKNKIPSDANARQSGYPILSHFANHEKINADAVEVYALKQLETVRIVTRITPMIGLIATLIPMGPALVALQENNTYAMSEHLNTAFTAVTISLAAASLTFWIASVKKRWFAEEIVLLTEKR